MELKKKMGSETNYGFEKKKNDGYWLIIYIIMMNYGIKKNNLWDELWICKKNDGYSMKIHMIIRNYGIGKK